MRISALLHRWLAVWAALLVSTACRTPDSNRHTSEAYSRDEFKSFFKSADWVETHLAQLPNSGALKRSVWNAHYWPSFRGGLLHKHFGFSRSPIEKFELAFKDQLMKANPHYRFGDLAWLESLRTEDTKAEWWGVCDGSSEAALYLDEPKAVVTYNGVKFFPFEVKGLLSLFTAMSSDQRRSLFAGQRMRGNLPRAGTQSERVDQRFRDVNPGLFHLALTNYVAIRQRGITADIIPTGMVLNFPVKAFRVLDEVAEQPTTVKMRVAVDFADSHRVIEPLPDQDSTMTIVYEYSLQLDDEGAIIGGKWLGQSTKNHPDFIWIARDESLDLASFKTGKMAVTDADEDDPEAKRLSKPFLVGPALVALLSAKADPFSSEEIALLQGSQDNLVGYRLFAGKKQPPLPKSLQRVVNAQSRDR